MNIYGLLLLIIQVLWIIYNTQRIFFKSNKSHKILSTKEHNVDS